MKTKLPNTIFVIFLCFLATARTTLGQTKSVKPSNTAMIRINEVYPLITTDKMNACMDFYRVHFGFKVLFEKSIFLQMSAPTAREGSISIAFMPSNHPFGSPVPGPAISDGKGLIITLEVDDSYAFYERLKKAGVPIAYTFTREAWGQQHFMVRDPAGTLIDVVQGIDPAPGYYDKYEVTQ